MNGIPIARVLGFEIRLHLNNTIIVAVVTAIVWVVRRWSDFVADTARIGWFPVLGAGVLGVLGVAVTAEVWRQSVSAVVGAVPRGFALRLFWASQAGKYLPGAVWPFLVQGLAARRFGTRTTSVLTGGALFLAVHAGVGLCLGSVGLAFSPRTDPWLRWTVWAVTGVSLLVLASGLWRRLPRLLGRLAVPSLDRAAVWRAAGWMSLAWDLYGTSTALLIRPLHGGDFASCLGPAIAAATVGWVAGLLVVIAPAGAGARELGMAWALHGFLRPDAVVAVVLLSRAILLVGDLGLASSGIGVLRSVTSTRADDLEPLREQAPNRVRTAT